MLTIANLFDRLVTGKFSPGRGAAATAAEVFRLITPHLESFGIIRLAELTGFDHTGIPVFMAVRPTARTRTVALAGGVDEPSAKLAALMAAAEDYHAEFNPCLSRLESYLELRQQAVVIDPDGLVQAHDSLYHDGLAVLWTEGFDLLEGHSVWIPLELAHVNPSVPPQATSGCFHSDRAGLASGPTLAEAVLKGLREIIARHVSGLRDLPSLLMQEQDARVDFSSVYDERARGLLERFRSAGVFVSAWNLTNDFGLTVIWALVFNDPSSDAHGSLHLADGLGCHLDPTAALIEALTGAAGRRLSVIASPRDDLPRIGSDETELAEARLLCQRLADMGAGGGSLDFQSLPCATRTNTEEDLAFVLGRFRAAKVERVVVVVDLSRPRLPFKVARTIVPDLACESALGDSLPGFRQWLGHARAS